MSWFVEAIRVWKRGPFTFSAMALLVLLTGIVLEPIPIAKLVAVNVLAPLLTCGLLYACLAADRGDRPRLSQLVVVFAAPLRSQAAIVVAGFLVTLVQTAVAWSIAGINLLMPLPDATDLTPSAVATLYAVGTLASLPLTFVPMAVLFDSESPGRAFALSLRAFQMNTWPLLALAAYTYALLLSGIATMGLGLLLALPWITAASYAAWKDIFGLAAARPADT